MNGLKVRYRGSASSIDLIDSLLRDEGLQVDHRPIVAPVGGPHDLIDVVLYVADPDVGGAVGAAPERFIKPKIENAIAKLRASVPRAQVEIVPTRDTQARAPA